MRARDVMAPATVVAPGGPTSELIEAFSDPDVRAVAVVTEVGELVGIITERRMLEALLPAYVKDDEALARVLEEEVGAGLSARLTGKRCIDLVDETIRDHGTVAPDDTLIEVAVAMVRWSDPAVLVVEGKTVLGVITVDVLLPALLSPKKT